MLPVPAPDAIEALARDLIARPSVVHTPGEGALARWLHARLARLPYFQAHPQQLELVPVAGRHERHALLAWLAGEGRYGVVLLGHLDTVDVADYGELAELAFDPDRLRAELLRRPGLLPEEARADLADPAWLWGRGAADMKAGVAVLVALVEAWAGAPPPGHVILLLTPDEEDGSEGLRAALPRLVEHAERTGVRVRAVINADVTGPLYPGDPHRYVYLGSVGKLLPAFYVRGCEAHAAEPLAGVDPNLLAGGIVRRLSLTPDLAEATDWPTFPDLPVPAEEVAPPPVALHQADLKEGYDVQTPGEACCWLNLLTVSSGPAAAARRVQRAAAAAVRDTLLLVHARRHRYAQRAGWAPPAAPAHVPVQALPEVVDEVRRTRGDRAVAAWRDDLARLQAPDLRAWCLEAVRRLVRLLPDPGPRVVLYYGSGFVPRTVVDPAAPAGRALTAAVAAAVTEIQEARPGLRLAVRRYYPYISDLSLACPGPDDERLDEFAALCPAWPARYRLAREAVQRLGAPGVNLGPYGRDPHRPSERVHRGYSFGVLPELVARVVSRLLGGAPA